MLLQYRFLFIGGIVYHYSIERFEMRPTMLSKLNTLLQILLVIVVIFSAGVSPLEDWALEAMIVLVAMLTILSGLQYIYVWSRRAQQSYSPDVPN